MLLFSPDPHLKWNDRETQSTWRIEPGSLSRSACSTWSTPRAYSQAIKQMYHVMQLLQPCSRNRFDFMSAETPVSTIFAGFQLVAIVQWLYSKGLDRILVHLRNKTNLCSWSSNSCWVRSRFSSSSPSKPFSTKPSSCNRTQNIGNQYRNLLWNAQIWHTLYNDHKNAIKVTPKSW